MRMDTTVHVLAGPCRVVATMKEQTVQKHRDWLSWLCAQQHACSQHLGAWVQSERTFPASVLMGWCN